MTEHGKFSRRWFRRQAFGGMVRITRRLRRFAATYAVLIPLVLVPVAHGTVFRLPAWLLWAWVGLVVAQVVANVHERGAVLQAFGRRLAVINGSLYGDIDTITTALVRAPNRRLSEQQAHGVCVGLLQRIRQFAALTLAPIGDVRLRTTLAVPLFDENDLPVAIRVWCYDEPYDDRRWSIIPLGLPGGPTAFAECRMEIVDDLPAISGIGELANRNFRSILSIPVTVGGIAGTPLAVMSIDASAPKYFTPERVDRLFPLVRPVVASLALVLVNLDPRDQFQFGNAKASTAEHAAVQNE